MDGVKPPPQLGDNLHRFILLMLMTDLVHHATIIHEEFSSEDGITAKSTAVVDKSMFACSAFGAP